ncbi:MAG: hypothetical protein HY222_04020 [Thaumarchaeota archaeon]|nr:hypothetical protein [Nitrososphaerota archaeon]MBI3641542.1 hypothetical protein [Nitrososphaerota archaeon]
MSEFIKCLRCGESVLVNFQAFEKITCPNCSLEMKKLLTWCKCSHAGINHADTILEEQCRFCDCPNFLHVQDRVADEYDKKLR